MRILITPKKSPSRKYLIHLFTKELINEVSGLIQRKMHSKAIELALSKGVFEREVPREEISNIKADLILSENNASWDLTGS